MDKQYKTKLQPYTLDLSKLSPLKPLALAMGIKRRFVATYNQTTYTLDKLLFRVNGRLCSTIYH